MAKRICSIPDCAEPATRRGWCQSHYSRWRAGGDPRPQDPIRRWHQPKETCAILDCARPLQARGWCKLHYERWRVKGDALWTPDPPSPLADYWAAHTLLRRTRGRAADHACVDCGEQSRDWSYKEERAGQRLVAENGAHYSFDVDDYEPRCRACHCVFDARSRP